MRKVITSIVATLVILGALLAFSGVAIAGEPTAITFEWDLIQGPSDLGPPMRGINTGTWSASGVVSDHGDVVENLQLKFNNFGNVDYGITEDTLTGTLGTITIRTITHGFTVISTEPFTIQFEGIWVVAGGTGAYAQLSGHGEIVVEVIPPLGINTATLTGSGHLPP